MSYEKAALDTGGDMSYGIVTAGEVAVGVGASALPDPIVPGGVDWLYWTKAWMPPVAVRDTGPEVVYYHELNLDVLGQRKLRENNTDLILLVGEEGGQSTINVDIAARILIRLP